MIGIAPHAQAMKRVLEVCEVDTKETYVTSSEGERIGMSSIVLNHSKTLKNCVAQYPENKVEEIPVGLPAESIERFIEVVSLKVRKILLLAYHTSEI